MEGFPFACVDAEIQTQPSAPHACPSLLLMVVLQSPAMCSGSPHRSKHRTNTTRMHEQNALHICKDTLNHAICVCGHMTHGTWIVILLSDGLQLSPSPRHQVTPWVKDGYDLCSGRQRRPPGIVFSADRAVINLNLIYINTAYITIQQFLICIK